MMMRSMPPASSHFAERPVPAPPPTIGIRRRTMSSNFSRIFPRSMRDILGAPLACDLSKILHQRGRKLRVVDVERQADQPALLRLLNPGFQRVEERRVGLRVMERLPRRIDRRHAFFGDEEAHLAFATVQ